MLLLLIIMIMLMIFIIKVTAHIVHMWERTLIYWIKLSLSLAFCLQAIEYFSHFSILCYCALLPFPAQKHVSADSHTRVYVCVWSECGFYGHIYSSSRFFYPQQVSNMYYNDEVNFHLKLKLINNIKDDKLQTDTVRVMGMTYFTFTY